MGNLLGTPITDKETHVGITVDEMTSSSSPSSPSSPDGGGLRFGISSMQGWRVHMEDAHIAQPFLFAERPVVSAVDDDDDDDEEEEKEEVHGKSKKTRTRKTSYERIPLPNHALFAVFDGHGGKFAAEYASLNLLRVLCRSSTFVEYAVRWSGREGHLAKVREGLISASSSTRSSCTMTATSEDSKGVGFGAMTSGGDDVENNDSTSRNVPPTTTSTKEEEEDTVDKSDRLRLQQLKKRGHDSDEKVRAIKEQVRRHFAADPVFDGDDIDDMEQNSKYQYAQATYDRELMVLLECSMRDAFLDLDAEILGEVRGDCRVEDANVPYALGHHHSDFHTSSPTIGGGKDAVAMNGDGGGKKDPTAAVIDHPVPSDDEDAGTTAVVVMTTPKWIVCANAGDSRAVYSKSSRRSVPLSYDHKPEDEDEERRIREAGGYVSGGRVEGDLAVSRGLGDYRFKDPDVVVTGSKGEAEGGLRRQQGGGGDDDCDFLMLLPSEQKVSPVPDIIVQNRDPDKDEFIVIACDGIWDVQTNQECVQMVADIFAEGESDLGLVCEEVLDLCLMKGSKDNMTAAVIKFPKQTIGKGGGVQARRERRDRAGGGGASARNGGGSRSDKQVYNPYVPPHSQREGGQQTQEGKGGVGDDDEGAANGGDRGNR